MQTRAVRWATCSSFWVRHCLKCGLTIVVDALASVLLIFFLSGGDIAQKKGKKDGGLFMYLFTYIFTNIK